MLSQSPLKAAADISLTFLQNYAEEYISNMPVDGVSMMLAPGDRRTSMEMLDEVAAFEYTLGFPLRQWVNKDEPSNERSTSPVTVDEMNEPEHPVLRAWSPSSSASSSPSKKTVKSIAGVQSPPKL